jgi:hypothetical protein
MIKTDKSNKQQNNAKNLTPMKLGYNQRRIVDYLEKCGEDFPEDIVRKLSNPEKNRFTQRSKIRDSIKRLVDIKNILIVGSKNKNLLAMDDPDYCCKYPKPKVVRINEDSLNYKRYCLWKKSKFL